MNPLPTNPCPHPLPSRAAVGRPDPADGLARWLRAWAAWWRRRQAAFVDARAARLDAMANDALSELSPRLLADIGADERTRERARGREEAGRLSRLQAEQGYRGWSLRW